MTVRECLEYQGIARRKPADGQEPAVYDREIDVSAVKVHWKCACPCHTSLPFTLHVVPCCVKCSFCNEAVGYDSYQDHLYECRPQIDSLLLRVNAAERAAVNLRAWVESTANDDLHPTLLKRAQALLEATRAFKEPV